MSDFSQSPQELLTASQQKGYVGLHIEQGVPLLDRDLNLLQDLLAAGVRSLFSRFVGNGVPAGSDGFRIEALAAPQDFRVAAAGQGAGSCLVDGWELVIPAATTYGAQHDVPPLTTPGPGEPDPRVDLVYLDGWVSEVDAGLDPDLGNGQDIGMQTSVRLQLRWKVLVAEGAGVPAPGPGHVVYPLAQVRRPRGKDTIEASMITDLRQRRLTLSHLEQRLALVERVLLLPSFASPAFSPPTGVVNQPITLNGSNFAIGRVSVLFGSTPAQLVGTPTDSQLVARVPGGLTPTGQPASVTLTVINEGGAVTSTDVFVVRPVPAFGEPGHQFSPTHGTPGTQVTLSGFNLNVGTPRVAFEGTAGTVVGQPTSTSLVAQVPEGLVTPPASSADVRITVTTPLGSDTSDDLFRAEPNTPPPTFVPPPSQQFSPQSGSAGVTVTLSGQNFNLPPVSVKFDTQPAVITAAPSATQIVVQVPGGIAPPGATRSVRLSVTTAGGTVLSNDQFLARG
jgi:hypothetical protein